MAVPAATPVIRPDEFTVAIEVLLETYGFEALGDPVPVKVVVEPMQTVCIPDTVGKAFTVTVLVAVQPLLSVYVIVAVPAATPVITPEAFTVAIEVLLETYGLVALGVPVPVKVVVEPIHTVCIPDTVGKAFTVTEVAVEAAL